MTTTEQPNTIAPYPGKSYQDILDTDTRPVPATLRKRGEQFTGPTEVPIEWYLSREVHQLEKERIWGRRWQMACRVEDIPEVGDTWVYDIADLSILIVRDRVDGIKAFFNACLHRGRALRDFPGRVTSLQCPFHGFTWNLDGSSKYIPCQWDFPRIDPHTFNLPELQVGTWGGFVFVNPDPNAAPLTEYLGELDSHFARWPLEQRVKTAHVAKVINANWKLAQEAFMESYHVTVTHPELLAGTGDVNSQYDVFGTFSRALTATAVPSPFITRALSEQEMFDGAVAKWDDEESRVKVPDGATARPVLAEVMRRRFRPALGQKVDELSDAEMIDTIYYTLYPNFHPWGGLYTLITYRFRPAGDDHERSIMETMLLTPTAGEPAAGAPIHWLSDDEDWLAAPELGLLGRILQQDMVNLEQLHRGLRSTRRKVIPLADYQELKVRHFYALYRQDMGFT